MLTEAQTLERYGMDWHLLTTVAQAAQMSDTALTWLISVTQTMQQ